MKIYSPELKNRKKDISNILQSNFTLQIVLWHRYWLRSSLRRLPLTAKLFKTLLRVLLAQVDLELTPKSRPPRWKGPEND